MILLHAIILLSCSSLIRWDTVWIAGQKIWITVSQKFLIVHVNQDEKSNHSVLIYQRDGAFILSASGLIYTSSTPIVASHPRNCAELYLQSIQDHTSETNPLPHTHSTILSMHVCPAPRWICAVISYFYIYCMPSPVLHLYYSCDKLFVRSHLVLNKSWKLEKMEKLQNIWVCLSYNSDCSTNGLHMGTNNIMGPKLSSVKLWQ